MRRFPALLLTFVSLALVLPAASDAAPTTGRVVVVLAQRDGARAQAAAAGAVAAKAGALRGPAVPELGVVALRPRAGQASGALAARLRRDPAVRSARPELRAEPRVVPNDPALSARETASGTPAGTPLQWAIGREDLPRAWDVARGDGALVGVIDTGIDTSHPDFAGKIARAVNQGGGFPSRDDDGHGTHVASQACAATGNGAGMAGTGYNCRIILERSDFSETSIAAGIVDAVNNGADAVNLSLGDDSGSVPSDAIRSAIDYAYNRGVVLVAAAADRPVEDQGWPANLLQPSATGGDLEAGKGLSVTSADFSGGRSSFAGRGGQISLAAYGSFGSGGPPGLFGAFPANLTGIESGGGGATGCSVCRTSLAGDNRYAYLPGTSMSTPQVAGIAALIKQLNPDLPLPEVLRILKLTASNQSWEPELGWGIVDAGAAVDQARRTDRTKPVSKVTATRRTRSARFLVKWKGSDPAPPGLQPSGVDFYEVYARAGSGPYQRIARTRRGSLRYKGKPGKLYRFYSLATDRAGNREVAPLRADAATRVLSPR
jgi:serine protease